MVPAPFDYRAPSTLDEALAVLKEQGDDAKIMAGGQSLIPLLKLRFAQPGMLVDIGRIGGLRGVSRNDGRLKIGALTRHADIERSQDLGGAGAILPQAAQWIADPLVPHQGPRRAPSSPNDPPGACGSLSLPL